MNEQVMVVERSELARYIESHEFDLILDHLDDILDVISVEAAMPGHQAVLCALGARKGTPSGTITVGTRHIVAAMERSGVRRLVFESAFGVADSREKAGFVFSKILLPLFFKESYEEKARQEAAIRASSLDWTIVRPVRLTDEPARGTHRVIEGSAGSSARVPFADVAGFMLAQLADNRFLQKAPGLMQ